MKFIYSPFIFFSVNTSVEIGRDVAVASSSETPSVFLGYFLLLQNVILF